MGKKCDVDQDAFSGKCVNSYRMISVAANYEDDQFKVAAILDYKLKNGEPVEESIFDIVDEAVYGQLDELVDDALASYNPGPKGVFKLCDEEEKLYSAARSYLKTLTQGKNIEVKVIDEGEEHEYDYSLYDYLSAKIEERENCETAEVDVGAVIENSLCDFASKSTWHVEFNCDKMALWFGIDGTTPDKPWIISEAMSQDDIDFWLYPDENSILNTIIDDCNDSFLIWYFAECGRACIDIEDVMATCPIKIEEDDTPEKIKIKINALLRSMSKCNQ